MIYRILQFITVLSAIVLAYARVPQGTFTWVSPIYNCGPPLSKEVVVIDHYRFLESIYIPPIIVEAVSQAEARYDTPEYAFISRISAMMSSNYDWWLETWDDKSRQLRLKADRDQGISSEAWIMQWRNTFSGARVMMVRRIETGDYVVITYRLRALDGSSTASMEIPAVLHKDRGRWHSTLDLMQDPLLPASPWVSGARTAETIVR